MPIVIVSYGAPFDFIAFFKYYHSVIKYYQTFTDYVSNQYKYVKI